MRLIFFVFLQLMLVRVLNGQCTCGSTQPASVVTSLTSDVNEVTLNVMDEKGKEKQINYLIMGDMLIEKKAVTTMKYLSIPNSTTIYYWEKDPNKPGYIKQPKYSDYWLPWEGGIVPYEFGLGINKSQKEDIKKAIKELNRQTNICITPRTNEENYIIFEINDKMLAYGRAAVGCRLTKAQSIELNPSCFFTTYKTGIIQHEICHSIGLFHMQMLPIRDLNLWINWENINPTAIHNFLIVNPLPPYYPNNVYGRQSVMHYGKCFGTKNYLCTMECRDPKTNVRIPCDKEMGTANHLSNEDIQIIDALYPVDHSCEKKVILFLFDVSGSMNEGNKFTAAKNSAQTSMAQIEEFGEKAGVTPEVGIMIFSGECGATAKFMPGGEFTDDLASVKKNIERIPFPNGGTPLPDAIQVAEKQLQDYLEKNDMECGIMVILSDGESTCGPIRPQDAYAFQVRGMSARKSCSLNAQGKPSVAFYTVGLGLQPGSPAERDLQYLSSSTGGKYFTAQGQQDLTRAFQKISQIFVPISQPQGFEELEVEETEPFYAGTGFIYTEEYDTSLMLLKQFITAHPTDSSGLYNYALMCEANDRYKSAAKYLEVYLKQSPNEPNRRQLLDKIAVLKKDYENFIAYNKQLIQSDLAYLNLHFERLQNTPDAVPLAGEFVGFIREKQAFYKLLPDILELDEPWLKQYSKEINQALKEANFYLQKKPEVWGDEGVYRIGLVHEPMRRLVKQLGN